MRYGPNGVVDAPPIRLSYLTVSPCGLKQVIAAISFFVMSYRTVSIV
jgi:hypothetical protein